ncbi:MAG TPA: hypothetical protein VNH11_14155 [Pirellulales bacterium]|nr:hypothetical protein [Pirellulales bacterium]
MNWSDHKDLAVGLRDQGLADCVAARFALRPDHERGNLQPLTVLAENTEYPFWSAASEQLVTAACGLTMENHGVRAIKALRTLLDAMSRSDPPQFTKPIRQFLEDLPFSTAISSWPES